MLIQTNDENINTLLNYTVCNRVHFFQFLYNSDAEGCERNESSRRLNGEEAEQQRTLIIVVSNLLY